MIFDVFFFGYAHIMPGRIVGGRMGHRPANAQHGGCNDAPADQFLHQRRFFLGARAENIIIGQMRLGEADAALCGILTDMAYIIFPIVGTQGRSRIHGHAKIDVQNFIACLGAGINAKFHGQSFPAPLKGADIGGSG